MATTRRTDFHETKHSMKRRCMWHDYRRIGTYMLTLVVEGRKPLFGTLRGDSAEQAYVELTALGMVIKTEEIKKIGLYYPQVEVWKLCLMPDHLHMIVHINEEMPEDKHLGLVVRGFKQGCTKAWWRLGACVETQETVTVTVSSASTEESRKSLFEQGYNDKILYEDEQLDNWKAYLADNPRRLMMKRLNPELFTVLTGMVVAGEQCQVVGNRFLIDIPDKMAVIVHRRYTDEEYARLREEWLACGERGGVLVSAAISPKEKDVLREAMNRGYNIILLRENGFPKLYKPAGEAFDACAAGLLLQISPWEFHMEKKAITRAQCLHLNAMAERIVGKE